MADSKQYIKQEQENGHIYISEDVIGSIVAHAACEIEGVIGVSTKPGSDIAEFIGRRNWAKGIKVGIEDNNELIIDCNIVIAFGTNVVEVSSAVQKAIISAVEAMAGLTVSSVNVNVCEIVRQ